MKLKNGIQLLTRPYRLPVINTTWLADLFCLSPFHSPHHSHFLFFRHTRWVWGSRPLHFIFPGSLSLRWYRAGFFLWFRSQLKHGLPREAFHDHLPNIVPYLQSLSVPCPGFFVYGSFNHLVCLRVHHGFPPLECKLLRTRACLSYFVLASA